LSHAAAENILGVDFPPDGLERLPADGRRCFAGVGGNEIAS
jgi:hypothetical protein